jgi:hypothetical protein
MMAISRLVIVLACTLSIGGCKKDLWVVGKWLHVDKDGKPGSCHEFKKDKTFVVYTGSECEGATDPLLSGKFQLKQETKLAVLRGQEEEAHLALVTERTDDKFVTSGAIGGVMYKVGKKGGAALLGKLQDDGVVKVKALPGTMGCAQLSKSLKEIKALPTEADPRMIRNKDKGLEYHADKATGDPKIEKIVYALNLDVIEWISFHMTAAAFAPPGPRGRLEQAIGAPADTAATGAGEKRQHITMWRTYCAELRGAKNKDIDLTLFATAGQQRGTYYVSEKIIQGIWEEFKAAAADSANAPPEEEEGGAAATPAPAPAAKPAPAPAPAAKPAPAPAPVAAPKPAPAAKPAVSPKPATNPDDDI